MTITKIKSPEYGYYLECDFCSNYETLEVNTFYEVLDVMKRDGWIKFKNADDEWLTMCPICIEKKKNET